MGPGEMNPRYWQEHKRRKWRPLKDRASLSALASIICPEGCKAWAHSLGKDRFPEARAKDCCREERGGSLRSGVGPWDLWTVHQKSGFQCQKARPLGSREHVSGGQLGFILEVG